MGNLPDISSHVTRHDPVIPTALIVVVGVGILIYAIAIFVSIRIKGGTKEKIGITLAIVMFMVALTSFGVMAYGFELSTFMAIGLSLGVFQIAKM